MSNEYTTIKVKKDVGDKLKEVVDKLNSKESIVTFTVAGLITRLAEAYSTQLTKGILASNTTGWIVDGIPIITNSDGARHYDELVRYEPVEAGFIVSEFIRKEAMTRRFARIAEGIDGK